MKFSVVVCTFMRPVDILKMMDSFVLQTLYPDEIIIVDASTNELTKELRLESKFKNLNYYFVEENTRGSAKQRNFGIEKVSDAIEIICFLDDDVVLEKNYFEELLSTYRSHPEALGVGGFILNNNINWNKKKHGYLTKFKEYSFDGWVTRENSRNLIRKRLGLAANTPPGIMPLFSHGRNSFPPSDKTYSAELLMSGVCSYRKSVLDDQKFDDYFVGYSLYEDTALAIKISKKGPLYVNTKAKLHHYHASGGRPNQYQYGKMVVRNGWYVWRLKYPNPTFKNTFKWHVITLLLLFLRLLNIFTTPKKEEAFTESMGRFAAWLKLFISKPQIER